jgi:hypothetical protein
MDLGEEGPGGGVLIKTIQVFARHAAKLGEPPETTNLGEPTPIWEHYSGATNLGLAPELTKAWENQAGKI